MKQLPLGVRLRADAVFESFAPGSNAEVLAALRGTGTAPLWLWGPAGAGKTHLLQALFRTFNEVTELHGRLVFAAAVPPRQAPWVLEDWRSRAAACVVYQVRDLDDAGRIEALRLRAAQRGLQLPDETSEYLLKRMPRDLPSLLKLLDELDEASLVAQRRLTIPFIRDALEKRADTKS